jgi:RNA-binding protein YhbY
VVVLRFAGSVRSNGKGESMKDSIDAALRAAKLLQVRILKLKERINRDDPQYEIVDDAELGTKWVSGRIKNLANFTSESSDAKRR